MSSKGTDEQIDAVKKNFPQLDFQRLNGSRYTTERLKKILGSYGEETILYFNMLSVDGSGIRYNIANGIKFVSQAAKIPLYKGDEAGIGDGLLGGCVLSYDSIGHKTGQMARQVLTGARTPRQLGYAKGEFNYKFDVEMMKRFHIAKSQLPEETVYVNDPPSFYELHESVLRAAGMLLLLVIILGLLYDRRRNRLFNERLTQTQAEAKAAELANKAKTDFLSRMSHDIRTPLNAIIGLTNLAQDDLQDPDRMADNLRKIHSSGVILLSLLNDVLDVSRIESGRLVLHPEPYTLPEFLSQIHIMFDSQCQSRGLHFEILTGGESYTVLLDKVRFVQLIGNLLTNAVKFTPAGGHIKLEVRCGRVEMPAAAPVPVGAAGLKEAAPVRPLTGQMAGPAGTEGLSSELSSGKILPCTFIVSDDGPGMTAEFQKKMFEPFTQERSSRDALIGGSGLGLAIVKTIIELMGGTIQVQSVPGQGTRYTLQFRLCLAKEAELDQTEKSGSSARADSPANSGPAEKPGLSGSPEPGRPAAAPPGSVSPEAVFTNRRILLVEDHPLNAEIATRMLTKKGIQVELAINGREAVAKFEHSNQNYYDLILMDIRMPMMDGREATKEIRRLHRLDAMTIPIIAMTADAFDGDVNQSLQSGMNAQLNKPVEPKALYGLLAQYWRRT
jgi:signal transduction histidine kinase/BarA-like signal transduction histidine kinase